jgi:hypothetical protein
MDRMEVVMYNTNNNSAVKMESYIDNKDTNYGAVKMESYIDNKDTNYWVQVTNLTDNGGWSAKSSDEKFYSTNLIDLKIIL